LNRRREAPTLGRRPTIRIARDGYVHTRDRLATSRSLVVVNAVAKRRLLRRHIRPLLVVGIVITRFVSFKRIGPHHQFIRANIREKGKEQKPKTVMTC